MHISPGSNSCPSKVDNASEFGGLTPTEKERYEQEYTTDADISIKTHAADMLIRHFMVDSTAHNLDSVRMWLTNKGGLYAHFTIVDTWLQEEEEVSAQQAIANIPTALLANAEDSLEYQHFVDLKNIQILALQNNWDESATYANHSGELTTIAEAGDYHASIEARYLIAFAKGVDLTPDIILPATDAQRREKPQVDLLRTNIFPNPASAEVNLQLDAPGDLTVAVEVYNTSGKLIKTIAENNYPSGTFNDTWQIEEATPRGVYFLLFKTNFGIFHEKIVIQN